MYRTCKAALLLVLIAGVTFVGCSSLDNEGNPPPNNPPQVYFANIPIDGTTFSVNPILYWYGTDNDGTIEQYQYSVKRDIDVMEYLESHGIAITAPPDSLYSVHATDDDFDWITIWVDSVQTATRDDIRLFASFDTNFVMLIEDEVTEQCPNPPCTSYVIDCEIDSVGFENGQTILDTINCVSESIQQYMFIRAIDDDNSASLVKYRQYLRNNHWPQTKIENAAQFSNGMYVNIPRPNVTYQGITIAWNGSDSADYPRNQPDFEFHWRVFGPFDTEEEADTLDLTMLALDSGDSLTEDGWVRRPSGVWVTTKSATMIDLWRNEAASDVTRDGYFLFEVRTRDDAFAQDPSPSRTTFHVVDAKFERPILFVDDCLYSTTNQPLTAMGSGGSADGTADDEKLRNRIFDILYEATDGAIDMDATSADYYRRGNEGTGPDTRLPIELLARYSLVLVVDDDDVTTIPNDASAVLANYMNVGGNVWIFGRNCLVAGVKAPKDYPEPDVLPAGPTAAFYFDVEGMYVAQWLKRSLIPQDVGGVIGYEFIPGIDDFIGASPITTVVPDFPTIAIDTVLTKDYYIFTQVRILAGIDDFRFKTIPDANFLVRGTGAEPLYSYISRYAGTAYPHNKVCAVRYIGPSAFNPIFKTAWFSFSPYAVQRDNIVDLFRKMLAWFEE